MKNNQKGFASIILIGIIVILLGVSGYFFWSKKSNETIQNTNPIITSLEVKNTEPKTPTTTTKDETAGWKTYINDKYGFIFKYMGNGYSVNLIDDIKKVDLVDGICSRRSPQIFKEDKIFTESNPVGTQTDKLESSYGLHKIYKTASDVHALVSIQICQGDNVTSEDIANVIGMGALIFKGDTLVLLGNPIFSKNIKAEDVGSVAQGLLNGAYNGPEQEFFNQFIKTISTFKFTK